MLFMNEWDIENALNQFGDDTPNLANGATILARFANWTNNNSDGWPYWSAAPRAAKNLMEILNSAQSEYYKGNTVEDCTAQDIRKACTSIKRLLTKHEADHSEVF